MMRLPAFGVSNVVHYLDSLADGVYNTENSSALNECDILL